MPELIITITSASKGATDLIIGNAIGSNICNLLLILAVAAILNPIKIDREVKLIHLPVAYFSTILIFVLGMDIIGKQKNLITRIDGEILVILYLIYFSYPIITEIRQLAKEKKEKRKIKNKSLPSIIYIVLGVVLLKLGGDFVVDKASNLAETWGFSQRVIGLTIVAIGTALPELITAVIATIKKEDGLAIGNLIGSCIVNSCLILGTGAIINPLEWSYEFNENLMLFEIATLFIWTSCLIGKKDTITRPKATVLLAMFVYYMWKLFI